ncbi:ribosyldihydronicotinamide dehydrogenase [quinone]-like isoform X2 [Vombatus ursinus]|uniref:Ribosyldihydronicotinamide dehydrogenase [quinone] n=1 Tax=Vombatus ursinus TaxID=29139 RepID=A0A4X2K7J4_VOMUR|nr:ribosyldihydronicotinamide dehydrogenase [quinone]-like isoform X2 [Vombatus ursinus]
MSGTTSVAMEDPQPREMAGKRVLIVYAHQEPKSMNGSLKDAAVSELSNRGCQVTVSDLYAMNFEPRATKKDFTGPLNNSDFFNYGIEAHVAYKKGILSSDVIEEQKKVQEADLIIFQFPLYWFSVPAIMKGWMDRVLCQGFAFDFPECFDRGFLQNKLALVSFTTGGDAELYSKTGLSGDIKYILWPLQSSMVCCISVVSKSWPLRSALLLNTHQKIRERRWWLLGQGDWRPSGKSSR